MTLPEHLDKSAAHALTLCVALLLGGCISSDDNLTETSQPDVPTPDATTGDPDTDELVRGEAALLADHIDRALFTNPYGHIPAQCYIETSHGTQNACLFCHTNGAYLAGLGNNTPQAGYEPMIGNLQTEYAFAALNHPFNPNGSIMPWENTLHPDRLRSAVRAAGIDPADWDMTAYIREDNWTPAYDQRPGSPTDWDPRIDAPFRLLPGLDPDDLPADADGHVRSDSEINGFFPDQGRYLTGWRAVNFMPYGIFTPRSGSVSGIYIRLPAPFMRNAAGDFDLQTYNANLALLERAIQDRLLDTDPPRYLGGAADIPVQRGLYPLDTEFAHPLHYVDLQADGGMLTTSRYPGTRAERVKEVRYMYKHEAYNPDAIAPGNKDESAPIRANSAQGWADNNAGWLLSAFIEDAAGNLRPQTAAELVQCIGCHSGTVLQSGTGHAEFTSGVGNSIDSTWAFPRKFAGDAGWAEMDYQGYVADHSAGPDDVPGQTGRGDPINREAGVGEFRFFLDHVVGASLYGEMPRSMEAFLAERISRVRGYSEDWPTLDPEQGPEALRDAQQLRLRLMREFTARGEHLNAEGNLEARLFYPTPAEAAAAAAAYRQVVVTQRYELGKDVFPEGLFTLRYYRTEDTAFAHQDGTPYTQGELITDRPIDTNPVNFTYGVGVGATLIDESLPFAAGGTFVPDFLPLLQYPPAYER